MRASLGEPWPGRAQVIREGSDRIRKFARDLVSYARPSGTEDVYKVYAESFQGPEHLARIQEEAQAVVAGALA